MRADLWDSLPPDIQDIMMEVGHDVEAAIFMGTAAHAAYAEQFITDSGVTVVPLTQDEKVKVKELLAPIRDMWLEEAGPHGPEVLSIVDEVVNGYSAFDKFPR
jgi:TRAP-type C4-dicarboxylate transport system substrate-binding protein